MFRVFIWIELVWGFEFRFEVFRVYFEFLFFRIRDGGSERL